MTDAPQTDAQGLPPHPRRFPVGLGIAVLLLVLDQISKWWIVGTVMNPPRRIEVTPFFNLVMVWNEGVTFGLGNNVEWGRWLFAGLALVIVVILIGWLARAAHLWVLVALGLVIGGAIGNVIDRLRWGAVADFLDFHAFGWHWPAFNLADAGIVVGVLLLVLDALVGHKQSLA
ncbi:MAG: signal peptidase II [Alphaproteobacteria bacterium]